MLRTFAYTYLYNTRLTYIYIYMSSSSIEPLERLYVYCGDFLLSSCLQSTFSLYSTMFVWFPSSFQRLVFFWGGEGCQFNLQRSGSFDYPTFALRWFGDLSGPRGLNWPSLCTSWYIVACWGYLRVQIAMFDHVCCKRFLWLFVWKSFRLLQEQR